MLFTVSRHLKAQIFHFKPVQNLYRVKYIPQKHELMWVKRSDFASSEYLENFLKKQYCDPVWSILPVVPNFDQRLKFKL